MKILIVSNRVRTYALAFQNEIVPLISLGHEIIWAADFSNFIGNIEQVPCKTAQIDIVSYPFHKTNLKAFRQVCEIIKKENIEAISCSTPIGGTIARLAGWHCGVNKIIYEAHGFLFFKNVPLLKRIFFRLHEQLLARITDTLITITKEDFESAKKFKLRSHRKPYFIHGAGVKVGVELKSDRDTVRKILGFRDDDVLIISAGDLNDNKNNKVIIKALSLVPEKNIHYIICGNGDRLDFLKKLSNKLNLVDRVHFLGYRTDMPDLLGAADIFVMPSRREGIPRSILEAMDLGLPCIGSKTRGVTDLIDYNKGGFTCNSENPKEFASAISILASNKSLRNQFGTYNKTKTSEYSAEVVRNELYNIYKDTLNNSTVDNH